MAYTAYLRQLRRVNPDKIREVKVKRLKLNKALRELVLELRGVICHRGSHSVTCHPTQVNAPRLNHSQ